MYGVKSVLSRIVQISREGWWRVSDQAFRPGMCASNLQNAMALVLNPFDYRRMINPTNSIISFGTEIDTHESGDSTEIPVYFSSHKACYTTYISRHSHYWVRCGFSADLDSAFIKPMPPYCLLSTEEYILLKFNHSISQKIYNARYPLVVVTEGLISSCW